MTIRDKFKESSENYNMSIDELIEKLHNCTNKLYELNFELNEAKYHTDGEPNEKTVIGIMIRVEEEARKLYAAAAALKHRARSEGHDKAKEYIERILEA